MSGNGELPDGWTTAQLSDVSTILMGQSPPSSTYNIECDGLPFFQGKAEFGSLYPEPKVWCSQPGKIAEANDILLSVRAPVGPTNLAPGKCCIGRGLAAVRPETGLDLKYLLHAFRCSASVLDARGTGTTFKAVSGKVVREFALPIAPSEEQSRIADALDELFSDLDAGVAALERVRGKLKLYRASVLKAAVEGTLTAEWRAQHPHTEHASELLQRILTERRRRWEEEQLRKFKEKGQEPPTNWKAKYKQPVIPDTTNLPPLPSGWCWVSWAQVGFSQNGRPFPSSDYEDAGTKLLRPGNLYADGAIRWTDRNSRYMPDRYAEESPDLIVGAGELIINLTAQSLKDDFLGRVCITGEGEHCLLNQRLARLNTVIIPARFMLWMFKSAWFRVFVAGLNTGSLIQHMFTSQLEHFVFPLPSLAEQEVIVEAVEDQLSIIDHLEADLDAKLESAQALRQAILRHAFTGQLVPQNPNDEPASELLKRIAEEREARARVAAAAKEEPMRVARRKKS
ncbi:MAG: restriction endonuclease subunit S [Betaproteobacteria bacterium]|nr:restriction endonuclease subunit S [Betaproteobacteria bacterium]